MGTAHPSGYRGVVIRFGVSFGELGRDYVTGAEALLSLQKPVSVSMVSDLDGTKKFG